MIIVDSNLLIHGSNENDPKFAVARAWLEELFASESLVGMPWITTWAYLRVVTNAKIFPQPFSPERAFENVRRWLGLPNVLIPQPGAQHEALLRSLVVKGQARGPLISDAVLAAITIEHSASLATGDRDFARFPGLSFFDPLST